MLTNGQEEARRLILRWIDSKGPLFRLGGPAGSGKSYLIPIIAEEVGLDKCVLMTPTGKVANNLLKAGLEARTIHSCIYRAKREEIEDEEILSPSPEVEYEEEEIHFYLKPSDAYADKKLFIIDEGSMVGGKLLRDLMSFNVPILMVGDPNQLRPVNDVSVYVQCDYYLSEIVRQAQDSPIIWLSQQILTGNIRPGSAGNCMVRVGPVSDQELMYADVVLADTNKARSELNRRLRHLMLSNIDETDPLSWVVEGDTIICRTNMLDVASSEGFMLTNGTLGKVKSIEHITPYSAQLTLASDELGTYKFAGTMTPLKFPRKARPPVIELGYALTVHLSQGSEWPNVIYQAGMTKDKRAMYTAVTRAKQSLLLAI